MRRIKLFENFEDDDDSPDDVYFYIEDGSKKSIVCLYKRGGASYRESVIRGKAPYGFGSKTYQSYLKPHDLQTWLEKDYNHVKRIERGQFDDYLEEKVPALEFYIFPKDVSDAEFTAKTAKGKVFDIFADGRVEPVDIGRMDADEFFEDDAEGPIEYDELPDNIQDIVDAHPELKN